MGHTEFSTSEIFRYSSIILIHSATCADKLKDTKINIIMYQLVHSVLNSDWRCHHLSLLQTEPHSSSSYSAMDMVNL